MTLGTAHATEEIVFGPHTYTRTAGAPNQFTETITLPPTLTAPFRLHVQNGDTAGHHQILGATIRLNGTVVASTDDFYTRTRGRYGFDLHPVPAFDRPVALRTRNTLQVSLTGPRGSFIILTLFGTIPPPRLTKLEPPTLPISEGGTGTLTATISAAQPVPTTIRLESSRPEVATVPAKVTVLAGELSVAVPVDGDSLGTATITARLNGSHVHSTVTVTRARPTLTSLLPATLQLAPGASGRLTVTISAAQKPHTYVTLTSSNGSLVSLPHGGHVALPPGHTRASFWVVGVGQGTATITASLNGTTGESQVTVGTAHPAVVSLLPPILPLTEGSTGTLTVILNAAQPTDTQVALHTSDATIVGLPGDSITILAGQPSASVSVTGRTRGTATVTAALNGTSATAAITVRPPTPKVQGLTCPPTLVVGATATCTVTLNATQQVDTVVPLVSTGDGLVAVPESLTVPADALTASFGVTAGDTPGPATITAGPVNGTSQTAAVQVLPPPPTIVSLTPDSATLFVGATATVTLTLNAAQVEDTVVPLSSTPSGILTVPDTLTVPAGRLAGEVTVGGFSPGTATVTAGYLNGTQAQATLTVNQLPPRVTALTPSTLSLPKGKAGTLTVTIAPTQTMATVVNLVSNSSNVEVPPNVTVPAGAATAEFPVLTWAEGTATITAGPLNETSRPATVTVTPAELVTLDITPPAPSIPKGQSQTFTATGTYTDASSKDLTDQATWSSDTPTVASITSPGIATSHAEGQTTITTTMGAISDTATLTVASPVLASVALSPVTPSLLIGQTLQFHATGTLTNGTTQDVTSAVTWMSGSETAAIISSSGLATAVGSGTTTITATHPDGPTGSTTLTVTLPPPTLTSFSPSSGKVGTSVTLTGTNFAAVTSVRFNGVSAPGFTVNSLSSIMVPVPPGATTGPLAVATAAGTATSSGSFIVLPTQDVTLVVEPPTITAIAGTSVSLKVSTSASGGFTGLTTLSTGTLPAGVTAIFSTPALGPNASGLLTLTTSGSTPSPSTIEVRGTTAIAGTTVTRTATATLAIQAPGQTVLAGQVRDEDEKPLGGVTIKLGGSSPTTLGTTDAAGNFLVPVAMAGPQVFLIDGSTANTPSVSYASIPVTVTIQPTVANSLGFVPHLHAQPVTRSLPVAPSGPTPVTFATLPDFQVTIPAGVQIIGWDGQPNTQIGVRAVPLDRLAVPPLPAGVETTTVYMFSFGKVGGGKPSQPIPVTAPNTIGAYPGQQVELWYFNEAPDGTAPNRWEMFGYGTVSSDGKLIVSNPGVGIPRFCCGAWFSRVPATPQNRPGPETPPQPGPEKCPKCGGPIDLASGLLTVEATDFRITGRLPLVLTRTYRTLDPTVGPFGVGWRHTYEYFVRAVSPDMALLITPENLRPWFAKQPDGTFANTDIPTYRGARLTRNGDNTWSLRFKDGSTWTFNSAGWLTSQRDRNGNTLTITRDSQNRTSGLTDPAGRSLTFSYSGSGLTVQQVTDPTGRSVFYTYDANDRLSLVTDPLGNVTRYTHDVEGRLETITDPRGIVTERNTYDSAGRVIQQVQADGGTFQIAYQVTAGTITGVTETDPNGNKLTYRFGTGRVLTEATDALGQTTQSPRLPGTNLVTSRSDAIGRTTRYTYDAVGNVLAITDALNQSRTFTYDPTFNQVLTSADPLNQTTTYTYDATGNLTGITTVPSK
jgi:YD repeat-containing protein